MKIQLFFVVLPKMKKKESIIWLLFMTMLLIDQSVSQNTFNQEQSTLWAIYINPTHAFSKSGIFELGVEKSPRSGVIGKLGLGFRFKGTTDPNYQIYEEKIFKGVISYSCRRSGIVILVPVTTSSNCCLDSIYVTNSQELFIRNQFFLTGSIKFFSSLTENTNQPMFLEFGAKVGYRSYYLYDLLDGYINRNFELQKDEWNYHDGRFDVVSIYNVERYIYHKTLKTKDEDIFIIPYISYGLRFTFLKRFSIEAAGTAYYGRKVNDLNQSNKIHVNFNGQLGMWF